MGDVTSFLVVKYPQCVSNIIFVSKKEGKVRVYMDFRDFE
jgi:hypothetical protein